MLQEELESVPEEKESRLATPGKHQEKQKERNESMNK